MKRLITLILVVIGCFIVVNQLILEPLKKKAAQKKLQEQAEQRKQNGQDIVAIKVVDVIRHDYVDILDALGNVKGGMEFKLTFPIPGTIKSVNYRVGEKYKKDGASGDDTPS